METVTAQRMWSILLLSLSFGPPLAFSEAMPTPAMATLSSFATSSPSGVHDLMLWDNGLALWKDLSLVF